MLFYPLPGPIMVYDSFLLFIRLGVVAHTYRPSSRETGQDEDEFWAKLGSTVSSRPVYTPY